MKFQTCSKVSINGQKTADHQFKHGDVNIGCTVDDSKQKESNGELIKIFVPSTKYIQSVPKTRSADSLHYFAKRKYAKQEKKIGKRVKICVMQGQSSSRLALLALWSILFLVVRRFLLILRRNILPTICALP